MLFIMHSFTIFLNRPRLLLILTCFSISCSPIPRKTLRAYQDQPEILAAQHWKDLADSVVKDYATSKQITDTSSPNTKYRSVYIQKGLEDSAFDKAFYNYLTNSFIIRGYSISKFPKDSNVINFNTETYLYSYDRTKLSVFTYTSFALIADKLLLEIDNRDVNFLALGLVLDYLSNDSGLKNAEVILTISIEDQKTIKYKSNKEFYINPNDLPLYWSIRPSNSPRIEGIDSDIPLKMVTVPVI